MTSDTEKNNQFLDSVFYSIAENAQHQQLANNPEPIKEEVSTLPFYYYQKSTTNYHKPVMDYTAKDIYKALKTQSKKFCSALKLFRHKILYKASAKYRKYRTLNERKKIKGAA